MKKIREYYICDRCNKEILKEEINYIYYNQWHYELCDNCKEIFELFEIKVNNLKNQRKELEKEYQFGIYLPEDLENKGDE